MRRMLLFILAILSCTGCTTRRGQINETLTEFFRAVVTNNKTDILLAYPFSTIINGAAPISIEFGDHWTITDITRINHDSVAVAVTLDIPNRSGGIEQNSVVIYLTRTKTPVPINEIYVDGATIGLKEIANIPSGKYI